MNRPTYPPYYSYGGIRKKATNHGHTQVRWIQEFPDHGQTATQQDWSSDEETRSSESNQVSKLYRITSTGEKHLRAPLLNAYLLFDAPLRPSIGTSRDPFSTLPAPWKPPYGIVTSYFRYAVAPVLVQESFEPIDNQSRQQALDDIEWPMALSVQTNDAALFFAALALSIVHLPDTHEFSPVSNVFFFRWISSKCVEHLNKSLSDPARACSNSSIAAVAFISFCESMVGNHRTSAAIHQPGLRQMVKQRGGLPAVAKSSVSGRLVAQAVSSFDLVVASKYGCAPTFLDSYILALQDVDLHDIVPRIKEKAQNNADTNSPISETMDLPQRLRAHSQRSSTQDRSYPATMNDMHQQFPDSFS